MFYGVFPVSAPQPGQDFQVFPSRQIFIKSRGLNNRANAVAALFFKNGMIFTEKINTASRGTDKIQQHLHSGGFSGTVSS